MLEAICFSPKISDCLLIMPACSVCCISMLLDNVDKHIPNTRQQAGMRCVTGKKPKESLSFQGLLTNDFTMKITHVGKMSMMSAFVQ